MATLSVISIADVGKRDLPAQLRNRFTEVWVGEPGAREELAAVAAAYLADAVPNPPVDAIVDFYLAAKAEAVRQAARSPVSRRCCLLHNASDMRSARWHASPRLHAPARDAGLLMFLPIV